MNKYPECIFEYFGKKSILNVIVIYLEFICLNVKISRVAHKRGENST